MMNSLVVLFLVSVALETRSALTAAPDPELMKLVRRLGDKSFLAREAATRALEKRGGDATSALAAGTKDADPEIAERCRTLLPAALADVRKANIALLVKYPNRPPLKDLAGLGRFLAITGDDQASRQLYAQMMCAHANMIEAIERNPVVGNRLMGEFLGKAQERWSKADGIGAACDVVIRDYGEAALFLFVRSHPHFVVDRDHENVAHSIVAATKLRDALGAPQKAPGIKKLYLHWLGVERELLIANFGFSIAEAENLKEALPLAMKIVTDTNNPTGYRAELMIKCVAKFGGREQLKDLAPFLEDDELLGSSQRNSEPQLFMQFRDIALAVSVKLAGEKLADFGMLDDHQYGFPDDAARKAAFTKWKAWTEKHAKTAKK